MTQIALTEGIIILLVVVCLGCVAVARNRRRITVLEAIVLVAIALFLPVVGALGAIAWLTLSPRRPLSRTPALR